MRYYFIPLALFILILSSGVIVPAQTPDAAVNHYNHGLKKTAKGDLDGAIEDFSRAIEISSSLVPAKRTRDRSWNNTSKFDTSSESDAITVIDPFTADAYNNRGAAFYRKGDLDGAIGDFDDALRINPGLAAAYLNRGASRRAKGDLKGALTDLDRALSIKGDFSEAYNNRGALRRDLGRL